MRSSEPQPRKTGRLRKLGLAAALCVGLVVAAGAALTGLAVDTRLTAPHWLQDRISDRINRDMGALQVSFGDMSVLVGTDWVPRLRLRNVVLNDAGGSELARLRHLETRVALPPLLQGQVRPAMVRLSGAQVLLRRDEAGRLAVALDHAAPGRRDASRLDKVMRRIEALLAAPQFALLERIEANNLTLRYEDARQDRAWTADGGTLSLTRAGPAFDLRGDVTVLGARDYATTLVVNYSRTAASGAARVGVTFSDMPAGDIAGQSPALAWLEALEAPISGSLRASVDPGGTLGPLSATLQIGAGVLQPTPATQPVAFTAARSYFTYDPAQQMIDFSELSLDSAWVRLRAEGRAHLEDIRDGWPAALQAQIRVGEISAQPAGLYRDPVVLEGARMNLRLALDPFTLTLGEMVLTDQGQRMIADGQVRAGPLGWRVAVNGRMQHLAPDRLLALWPLTWKPRTRDWLQQNIRKVALSNLQVALRAGPQGTPDLFLGFDFADLEAVFVKDVPPITGAAGHGSIDDNRFVIRAERGHVPAADGGRVDISGTSFIIPDVRINRGPAQAHLRTQSSVTAALSLLDSPPFRFLAKAGRAVTLAEGQAHLRGQLDFLIKKQLTPEEVVFDVTGTLRDMRSETLLPGRILRAGTLRIKADNSRLRVGGAARIGAVPVTGQWQSPLGPEAQGASRVTGQIELSQTFADEFGIGLPPGSLSGAARAAITVDLRDGRPGAFTLRSDLAGLGLRLPQLDWALSQAATGQLEVTGRLGTPPAIDRLRLAAAGLEALGAVALRPDGQLARATFSRVRLGDWLDAPADLVGRGAGRPPAVQVHGGRMDLRHADLPGDVADGGTDGGARIGGPISLALDTLQLSDSVALQDFRAELDMAGGAEGTFQGRVNGGQPITGRVVPQRGRSAFRIRSRDAGAVLSAAKVTKQARGGTLDVTLTPAGSSGGYDGRLGVQGLRIRDAPALAALLNAISVVGILEQMAGEGIHFSQIDGRFHLAPDRLTLLEGSAVGAAMGISMDGYYFTESGRMDMRGVVSPLYMLNAIGGVFNRRGEGLIGFNYALQGTAADPQVTVNPLSALTPGLFRELFRRPPPTVNGVAQAGSQAGSQAGAKAGGQGRSQGRSQAGAGLEGPDR